jgi:hypothetical protein
MTLSHAKTLQLWILGAAIATLAGSGVALAANAVDPADGSLDLARSVYDAFSGGRYAYCGALAIVLLVALVKRYAGPKVPWLHTDAGGSTLVLAGSTATAAAAALAAPGATVSLALMKTSLMIGVAAAGGFSIVKALLIEPLLKPLQAKLPAWAQPIMQVVMWIFDKPDPIAEATAAGNAAVAASPSTGVAGVSGKSTEVK